MTPRRRQPATRAALALLLAGLALGACAGTPDAQTSSNVVRTDDYAAAFDATRRALREHHFDLDRVDAAGGVITTFPTSSAGLATPWIDHASTFTGAVEGVIHRDRRTAVVEFKPAAPTDDASVDLRAASGPLLAIVRVSVERAYVPDRRADATSIRLTSRPIVHRADSGTPPALERGVVDDDAALAARIARAIRDLLDAS